MALGGSLHQAVQEVSGKDDHRESKQLDLDTQYAPVHPVRVVANGKLAQILGANADEIMVTEDEFGAARTRAPGC